MRSGRDTLDRASHSCSRNNNNNNDTWAGQESFLDNDPFDCTAIQSTGHIREKEPQFIVNQPSTTPQLTPIVKVYVHEQLAALYDESSNEGVVNIEGTVYVQAAGRSSTPFYLVLRDLLEQIEHIEEQADVCYNMTDRISLKGLHHSDRVLRITLNNSSTFRETIVLKYFCVSTLRPVPLLVKSRVRQTREYTRVGFKIRANPSNQSPLFHNMIIMAVPPSMHGDSVRLSRPGGVWDEMKRTIAWSVKSLQPGEALEIQAQFVAVDGFLPHSPAPTFPVLVRSEYPKLFSAVEVVNDYWDAVTPAIQLKTACAGRLLHRKV